MKANRARRTAIAWVAALCALLLANRISAQVVAPGQAGSALQIYPGKAIRLVVNVPPGGAADLLGRAIALQVSESLKQQMIVENRAGANGNLGADTVAKSPNDGHTLLMSGGDAITMNPLLYSKLPFDAEHDLAPVAAVARVPLFLVAHRAVPATTVAELVAYAKAHPGKLSYASPGSGSAPHLAGEMFKRRAGFEARHLPAHGATPAPAELLAGQAHFMFVAGAALEHVNDGRLKLLAVGSPKRSARAPAAPTLVELGIGGFDVDTVFGIHAPAGTPAAIIEMLHEEVNKALATRKLIELVKGMAGEVMAVGHTDFIERLRKDRARYGALISEVGLKAE